MKRALLIVLSFIIPVISLGQVTIMETTPVKEDETVIQYDSLSNFILNYHGEHYDYCHLKGQTIIYCGIPYKGYAKKPFKIGDSFYVKDILHTEPSLSGTFVIQNTKTKAIYKEDLGTTANKCWVVNGHLEKLKQLCVGKVFLYKGPYDSQSVNGLISAKEHKPLSSIPYRSLWKCIDVQVKPRNADDGLLLDERSPVVLLMESEQFGRAYCFFEYNGGPFGGLAVFSEKALFETPDDFTKRMVEKYGEETGYHIATSQINESIRVGMTEGMCLDAWGAPVKQSRRSSSDFKTYKVYIYPRAEVIISSTRHITEIIFK